MNTSASPFESKVLFPILGACDAMPAERQCTSLDLIAAADALGVGTALAHHGWIGVNGRRLKSWRTPAGKLRLCDTKNEFLCRAVLPYGQWTCADGRRVLYNRWYTPIWQRSRSGWVSPADPHEWVVWIDQHWFYKDGNPPYRDRATKAKLLRILEKFGVG